MSQGKSVALPAVRRSNDLATNPESLAEFGRQERFMADQMLREMNAFQRQVLTFWLYYVCLLVQKIGGSCLPAQRWTSLAQ